MQRPSFDALRTLRGALVVGSPEQVVEKILFQHSIFGHDRFLAQMSVGSLEHAKVLLDRAPRDRGGAVGARRAQPVGGVRFRCQLTENERPSEATSAGTAPTPGPSTSL